MLHYPSHLPQDYYTMAWNRDNPECPRFSFVPGSKPVPARQHINPDGSTGGWVDNMARVSPDSTVGPDAVVYGPAVVEGGSHIYGRALVGGKVTLRDSMVVEQARVLAPMEQESNPGLVMVNSTVCGSAQVRGARKIDSSTICGQAQVGDGVNMEIYLSDTQVQDTALVLHQASGKSCRLDSAEIHGKAMVIDCELAYVSLHGSASLRNCAIRAFNNQLRTILGGNLSLQDVACTAAIHADTPEKLEESLKGVRSYKRGPLFLPEAKPQALLAAPVTVIEVSRTGMDPFEAWDVQERARSARLVSLALQGIASATRMEELREKLGAQTPPRAI